ncbi:opsin, ultraviolet-sensitive-like isoform X2 [Cloeon dipterum]|uniref:opsin, ultraviolet-sensitive-like isoform X2 n=1 Tax=Cloeon dipterum TaxID=197152 RepID=UPI003220851E
MNLSVCLQCQPQDNLTSHPHDRPLHKLIGWNVKSEDLEQIPRHWLSYEAPEPAVHYFLGSVYVLLTIAALVGNGLVIWIFSTARALRSASNVFVINLAVADFLMMSKTPIFIINSFHEGYALGHVGCQLYGLVGAYSGFVQAASNACIAYDRYKCISSPLDGKVGKKKAITLALLTWTWATPWALLPLFQIWGRFVPEGYLTSCTFDYMNQGLSNRLFVLTIFVCAYLIPMSLVIYFYSQIVGLVVDHEKALKEQMNVESLRRRMKANTSAEIRIARAAIGICLLYVISWTPYAIVALIGVFGNQALLRPEVSMVPALFCKLVACVDPYVYAISHPRYRAELNSRWPWLHIKEPPAPTPHSENASLGSQAAASL